MSDDNLNKQIIFEKANDDFSLLIKEVKQNNSNRALFKIIMRFKPLMINVINKYKELYSNIPLDFDDMMSCLNFEIFNLIKNYDEKYNKTFPMYLKLFLNYKLDKIARKYCSGNHKIMNFASTIETEIKQDFFTSDNEILLEELNEMVNNTKMFLTNAERDVIKQFLENDDLSFAKISKKNDKNYSNNYSALVRAKRKIYQKLKSNNVL